MNYIAKAMVIITLVIAGIWGIDNGTDWGGILLLFACIGAVSANWGEK